MKNVRKVAHTCFRILVYEEQECRSMSTKNEHFLSLTLEIMAFCSVHTASVQEEEISVLISGRTLLLKFMTS